MDKQSTCNIPMSEIIKEISWALYYKMAIEKDEKCVNNYFVLTIDELKDMLKGIKVFSSIILIPNQTMITDNGILCIYARYGVILSQFEKLSSEDLNIEICNSIKNYYADHRNIDVCVRVVSCNHHQLIIEIPVSKFGLKSFNEVEYLKLIHALNQEITQNLKEDRYVSILKKYRK